jgi:predicted esterase YcpF (UPF0227 family)
MKKIVYFHGYGSSPEAGKVLGLRSLGYDVVAMEIPKNYTKAKKEIFDFLENLEDCESRIFVGSSLGGYWAYRFGSTFRVPTLLINPSIDPQNSLKKYDDPEFDFQSGDYPCIKNLAVDVPRIVLISMDDEVISPKKTIDFFNKNSEVVIFHEGGHRFDRVGVIAEYIDKLHNSSFVSNSDGS